MSKTDYDEELLKFNLYKESKGEGVSDDKGDFSVQVDSLSMAIIYMLENIRERLTRIEGRQDLIIKTIKNKRE